MFFRKKKEKIGTQYAGFNDRIMATLIDLTCAFMIYIPLMALYSHFVYQEAPPSSIMQNVFKDLDTSAPISVGELFSFGFSHPIAKDYFLHQGGIAKIVIEQLIQLSVYLGFVFFFWVKRASTPGKMFLSMKILDKETMKPASTKQLALRLVFGLLGVACFFLGYFWIVWSRKKQAWHDIFAKTVVVKQ